MAIIGIIGGSGLYDLPDLEITQKKSLDGPYGIPSSSLVFGKLQSTEVIFIPRHGHEHTIAPHDINYRANIWALHHSGVRHIIAINAVGGITQNMNPLKLVFPHQIIDYTCSRKHSFYDTSTDELRHIDFSFPYSESLRETMIEAAKGLSLSHESQAVYGATQGPRLETAAEIVRMQQDGCDIVGMTGMPEASLARELDIEYACCSVVVNWAAGKNNEALVSIEEIEHNLKAGMASINRLLVNSLPDFLIT